VSNRPRAGGLGRPPRERKLVSNRITAFHIWVVPSFDSASLKGAKRIPLCSTSCFGLCIPEGRVEHWVDKQKAAHKNESCHHRFGRQPLSRKHTVLVPAASVLFCLMPGVVLASWEPAGVQDPPHQMGQGLSRSSNHSTAAFTC
jgi:hypothetical protein